MLTFFTYLASYSEKDWREQALPEDEFDPREYLMSHPLFKKEAPDFKSLKDNECYLLSKPTRPGDTTKSFFEIHQKVKVMGSEHRTIYQKGSIELAPEREDESFRIIARIEHSMRCMTGEDLQVMMAKFLCMDQKIPNNFLHNFNHKNRKSDFLIR